MSTYQLEKQLKKIPGFEWTSDKTYISPVLNKVELKIPYQELFCIRELVRIGSPQIAYENDTVARIWWIFRF